MEKLRDVCNYVVFRLTGEGGASISHLKLQKLLFYIQAWNLAYEGKGLFDGEFQAWIHGPVNRSVYNRFKDSKYMYSNISLEDLGEIDFKFEQITDENKTFIDGVLEVYAPFSDTQLEKMTHDEAPWQEARGDLKPYERCEEVISEKTMADYYSARLKNA
ncbi:Panacea domain-containing protein [Pedobacter sp. KACC 23697]|uniref:Type II toxin-antitoxin system antitoxin SocA domain-containing protein n=1 Tax=Pedobacter sp. KACC 23697 TaxID=3149230 RepID=A0AAU7K7P3_9SPHI